MRPIVRHRVLVTGAELVSYICAIALGVLFGYGSLWIWGIVVGALMIVAGACSWQRVKLQEWLIDEKRVMASERDEAYEISGREQHARLAAVKVLDDVTHARFMTAFKAAQTEWNTQPKEKRAVAGRLLSIIAAREANGTHHVG